MVPMVVVAIAGGVVVAVVAAFLLLRWRGGDEVQSVRGYRHTLDTLGDLQSRSDSRSMRTLGSGAAPSPPEDASAVGGAPRTGGESPVARRPGRPLVFEDAGAALASYEVPRRSGGGGGDRYLSRMNRRPRRLAGPIVVAAVVLAVLGIVVALGAHTHKAAPKAASSPTTAHPGPTTVPRAGHGRGGPPRTTTTTQPTVALVSSTSYSATYSVPSGEYNLTLGATTGACWLSVETSSGKSLYTNELGPGQSTSVQADGAVIVDVGAPSVLQLAVDGTPLTLPSGYLTPFHVTLQPGATPAASGSTSTTATTAPVTSPSSGSGQGTSTPAT